VEPLLNDSSKATRAASTKVLLIADDIDDQELIGDALAAARGQSFELLAVPTLADGTENLGKNSIDVVLSSSWLMKTTRTSL
jgi:DNA-binding NtrC family response regulator